jgi:hypothetical protein
VIRTVNMRIEVDENQLEELHTYLTHLKEDFNAPLMAWVMPPWTGEDTSMHPIITWDFGGPNE